MKNITSATVSRLALLPLLGALVIGLAWPLGGAAQDKPPDSSQHKHTGKSTDVDKDLPAQLRELKAKVATLEAALEKRYPGAVSKDATPGKGMGMMGSGGMGMMGGKGMGMMGGADDDDMTEMMKTMRTMMQMKMMQMMNKMGGMSGMQGKDMGTMPGKGMGMMDMDMMMGGMGGQKKGMGGMSGMGMMEDDMDMMGMMGKGSMGGMGAKGMKMASALPGFPGASHIYHIGATDFFLDHPEHITLTTEQQTKLNKAKQKALLEKSKTQRNIDDAEQALWELTGADQPDAAQIQAKVQEIEKLRGEQRLAFIRSVGEAAKVLTDEQRQVLLGHAKPQEHKHTPASTK
jgi:hypothetical protein